MHEPIIGSEARASGRLTRGALRWNYRALHPDVYVRKGAPIEFKTRAMAAWLWTGRRGVLAGKTAAALHGVRPIDDAAPIELIAPPRRTQPGVVIRNERLDPDEVDAAGLPTTTPARTALDLAPAPAARGCRRPPRPAQRVHRRLGCRCRPTRGPLPGSGMGSAWEAIKLMDGGSRSPEETRLRLSLINGGLPRPSTGIAVGDAQWDAVIGMGWADARVGIECGEHRRSLPEDLRLRDLLYRLDWLLIEAMPQYSRGHMVRQYDEALRRRRGRC